MITPVSSPRQIKIIIRKFTGEILISEVYAVTEEVSHIFLNRMELMLLSFPDQIHVTKTFKPGKGLTVLEIAMIPGDWLLPAPVYPSFEQLFQRGYVAPSP